MAMKSQMRDSKFMTSDSLNADEILHERQFVSSAGAVGSISEKDKDQSISSISVPKDDETESDEDRAVAEKLEQKRLEHERQRNLKRELFEQQMHQLEIQQLQEEQAMLASKSSAISPSKASSKLGSFSGPSEPSLPSLRSVPVSRRNSDDEVDLWGEMDKLSLGTDKTKRDTLPKIGNRSSSRDDTPSPSESAFADNAHLSQYTERFIFEDDNSSVNKGSSSRLPSLQMNRVLHDDGIWKDKQSLGAGSSTIGSTSYLHRYLMNDDDDTFPTMLSTSSSALDLAQIPSTSGLPHSGGLESGRTSEWPQYNKTMTSAPHMPQRTNSLIGYGVSTSAEESLKSALPKLTSSYSTSELPTRFNKGSSLSAFDDLTESEHHHLLMKSDMDGSDVCLQFQQGYCPRGDLCPFPHTHALSRSSLPLSPGLGMSVGSMANGMSSNFYARMSGSVGGSTNSLANVTNSFPFNGSSNSFVNPSGSTNLLRLQQQQMQQQQQQQQQQAGKGNQKRPAADVEANRFAGAPLEGFVGQIYALCKDQHGCRYLQKKLEEQNEKYLTIIFGEVFGHFVELMTDPFGNYLCQKLLEYCGDEQRTVIVETVAPELVNISLNMHGTRAVQKMIEFLSTPQQIAIVVVALNPSVVTLIKDLNGNHVIQKCLNRLASEDNQFIYNAISAHCVEVATHRHGCCVLQRCIDHASVSQKIQLVREITYNALTLVQDPFGNYVVQYVLDLADSRFTDSLIRRFIGNVCALSVQKFSSNVMEKCIRVAEPDTRKFLIEEMINKTRLDKLLRDSYANYVVQTSLDFADPIQRTQLVECIRPLLPAIRNTPYGKRIQSKLHRDQMSSMNQLNHHLNGMGGMGAMNGMGMNGLNMQGMNGMGMSMGMNMGMGTMNGMNGMNMPNNLAMNNMTMNMGGMNGMNGLHSNSNNNNNNNNNNGGNQANSNLNSSSNSSNMAHMSNMASMNMGPNMANMNGMNGNMMGNMNNMNGNMMGFGFPGMNHFGNVGMIGMNDYNPYGYM